MHKFNRFSRRSGNITRLSQTQSDASNKVDKLYQRCEDYKTHTTDLLNRFRKESRSSQTYNEESKKIEAGFMGLFGKVTAYNDTNEKFRDCLDDTRNFQINYVSWFSSFYTSLSDSVEILSKKLNYLFVNAKAARKNFTKAQSTYEAFLSSKKSKDMEAEVEAAKEAYYAAGQEALTTLEDTVKEVELQLLDWMCTYWKAHWEYHNNTFRMVDNISRERVDDYKKYAKEALTQHHLMKANRSTTSNSFKEAANVKVFGCPLDELIKREDSIIPEIVNQMISRLMITAPTLEGVFRISAMKSALMKLQEEIDKGQMVDFADVPDAHLVPALLKQFLRDLPEPLLTFELYSDFIKANNIESDTELVDQLRALVKKLPTANRALFKRLMGLLSKIVEYEDVTKMGPTNLSTVIGPNILYDREINPLTMVEDMENANSIVVTFISRYHDIFRVESPLEAAQEGDLRALKRFHKEGKSFDEVDGRGRNVLHALCKGLNLEGMEFMAGLSPCPVDVNAADNEGMTPLMICCAQGSDHASLIAQFLLGMGADTELKNPAGKSAMDIAAATSSELHDVLVESMRNPEPVASKPRSRLAVETTPTPTEEPEPTEPSPEEASTSEPSPPASPKEAPATDDVSSPQEEPAATPAEPTPAPSDEKPAEPVQAAPQEVPKKEAPAPKPVVPAQPKETPEQAAERIKARASALLKEKMEARGISMASDNESVGELEYERVRSLQVLLKKDVPLQSVYSLINVVEMTTAISELVKASLPATFGNAELVALNNAIKGCVEPCKNLFIVVKKFAALFSDDYRKEVPSNAIVFRETVKTLLAALKTLATKPKDPAARENLLSNVKQMVDCVYKFYQACEVATDDFILSVSQTCAGDVTKILEAGNGALKEDLDQACDTAAFSCLKLTQLVKCKGAQRSPSEAEAFNVCAAIIERSTLELINDARRLWSQGEKPTEESKTLVKKILSEFRQIGDLLNRERHGNVLTRPEQADQFNQLANNVSDLVQQLAETNFTSELDKGLVSQIKQISRKLETLASLDELDDRTILGISVEIADILKRIRVGLDTMAQRSRDPSLNRRLNVWSEALLSYTLALRLSASVTVLKLPVEEEIQLFPRVDGAVAQCNEFYTHLMDLRAN